MIPLEDVTESWLLGRDYENAQRQWIEANARVFDNGQLFDVSHVVANVSDRSSRILIWGATASGIIPRLQAAGYTNIDVVDHRPGLVDAVRREHPGVHAINLNTRQTTFPDATYGCVILHFHLSLLVHSRSHLLILDDVFRILQPGGVVILTDYLLETDSEWQVRQYNRMREVKQANTMYGVFELSVNDEDGFSSPSAGAAAASARLAERTRSGYVPPGGAMAPAVQLTRGRVFMRHFEEMYLCSLLAGDMPSVDYDEPRFGLLLRSEVRPSVLNGPRGGPRADIHHAILSLAHDLLTCASVHLPPVSSPTSPPPQFPAPKIDGSLGIAVTLVGTRRAPAHVPHDTDDYEFPPGWAPRPTDG